MSDLTIKLIKKEKSEVNTISKVIKSLDAIFTGVDPYFEINVDESVFNDELESAIESKFKVSIRDGVSGGCYGARDGKVYEGITVFADLSNWNNRFIDSDNDEIINPYHLINEYSINGLAPISDDAVETICENLECKEDNTYNFNGHDSSEPVFLTNFQFKTIQKNEKTVMFVRFHCGGDVRGNYGNWFVCSFDYEEDLYSVIYPYPILKDDE
jgi:hypothetical protein